MTELKPCPFCGKEVSMGKTYPESGYYFFCHQLGVDCPIVGKCIHIDAKTETEAINKWNRRAE